MSHSINRKRTDDDPPYWFVVLVATAEAGDREAQAALRMLTRVERVERVGSVG